MGEVSGIGFSAVPAPDGGYVITGIDPLFPIQIKTDSAGNAGTCATADVAAITQPITLAVADNPVDDAITLTASDRFPLQADTTVTQTSQCESVANRAPVANNESYSTNEDASFAIASPGVLANDTDADGNSLATVLVNGPSHGTLALAANGAFTYTPAQDFMVLTRSATRRPTVRVRARRLSCRSPSCR